MRKANGHAGAFWSILLTIGSLQVVGAPSVAATQAFQEAGGQVTIEAEHYDAKIPRSGEDWVLETTQAGYAGSGYLTALPNASTSIGSGYLTSSPELDYNVSITTPGTYYVWIRGYAASISDDTIHAGIDGTAPSSGSKIGPFPSTWGWSRSKVIGVASVSIPAAGLHTFSLWMSKDGFRVDRIFLTTDNTATPSGTGPVESPRVGAGGDTTPPSVSLTSPSGGSTLSGTVSVSASASDDVGVVGVQFKLDGANLGAEDTTSPYGVTWDTTTSSNATHTLTAVARDAAGNTTTSNPVTVTVTNAPADTTPPSGSITINGGAPATNVIAATLTLSATDNSGVVSQMRFSNDGATYSSPEPYATTKTWTMTSGDGTKTISVKFADAAGNWSAPVSAAIVLDTTPPQLTFTSPIDGAVITAPSP